MPIFKILNAEERRQFDSPPHFNGEERKKHFRLNKKLEGLLDTLRTPTTKVVFLLLYGYLQATGKLYSESIKDFNHDDVDFVAKSLVIPIENIQLDTYSKQKFAHHRSILLDNFGYLELTKEYEQGLREEIRFFLRSQTRQRQIFGSLADKMVKDGALLPSYNFLAGLIDEEARNYDLAIETKLKASLTPEDITELEELLTKSKLSKGNELDETLPENTPYILTELKHFNQSFRPSKINKNLDKLHKLKNLYSRFKPAKEAINFTDEGVRYYAQLTINQKLYQIIRKSSDARLIYFYCFVKHQYYGINDTLGQTILDSATAFRNQVKRTCGENYFETRKQREQLLKEAQESRKKQYISIQSMKSIVKDENISDEQKVAKLNNLIEEAEKALIPNETLRAIEEARQKDEFHFMEINYRKLANKVGNIIKVLEFNKEQTDNPELLKAIEHYNSTNGEVGVKPPIEFLSSQQRKKLKKGKEFKKNLYKVLLFLAVAENLRAGRINLIHSYKYRSAEEYLFETQDYEQNQDKYLNLAGLEDKKDFSEVSATLTHKSDETYTNVNEHILQGINISIQFDNSGRFTISTPKVPESKTKLSDLLPKEKYISLIEIMYLIANSTSFCELFESSQHSGNKQRIDKKVLLATIFALGCNIGVSRAAKITKLSESELEYAKKWFLSQENLKEANEKIVEAITKLDLPNIYKQEDGKLYTSSDGQKVINNTETQNANYSYKYGGGARLSVNYTHIDMRHILFNSTVISASEREAIYVVDGLLHSKWIKSDIHSTDTFGSTEAVFGLCYLLGFDLVPRIKDLNDQTLYAIEHRSVYEEKKYKLVPVRKIRLELIEQEWDNLLRLASSIKLGVCSGSQILKRLNSYSRKNNLYLALRELGRLIKSVTILTYLDDPKLRMMVEKLLNVVEHSNRFSKVVRFGNGGEMYIKEKENQDIAESCKRLQENSIILHNYYCLTDLVQNEPDEQKKIEMLRIIRNGSPISWSHINFFGEYNFNEEDNLDSLDLNPSRIREFRLDDYRDRLNAG